MQVTSPHQALQDFVWAISYGKFDDINVATADGQEQALDNLMQLFHYCEQYGTNIPEGLHIFSEFFALPSVETFFSNLFVNLHESLFLKAESVFLRGLAFTVEYIGLPKSRETVYLLLEKLQERFPVLKEMYDTAIANFIEEFFQPTIGDFVDKYKNAITYLEEKHPLIYSLFVEPLKATQLADCQLYNFYCNPWIYGEIMYFLSHYDHQDRTGNNHCCEKYLKRIEKFLQIIKKQTNESSWSELTKKAHNLCTHSNILESFATQSCGLLGEIKAAVYLIKNHFQPKDLLIFLPEIQKVGGNCDFMIIRFKTGIGELVESKAKTPRHGLDVKIAGDAQIWDDFFDNFASSINVYLRYLENFINPILGLPLRKCYPLFSKYEGSFYGKPLQLIENILISKKTIDVYQLSSKQKIAFLLQALFFSPLVLDTSSLPLPSDEERLIERTQETKNVFKKDWVASVLNDATRQLEETRQRQTAQNQKISKLYVAMDINLSYRLLYDPFSYYDGNIKEIAEEALKEVFQSYKEAFLILGINLDLIIVNLED